MLFMLSKGKELFSVGNGSVKKCLSLSSSIVKNGILVLFFVDTKNKGNGSKEPYEVNRD